MLLGTTFPQRKAAALLIHRTGKRDGVSAARRPWARRENGKVGAEQGGAGAGRNLAAVYDAEAAVYEDLWAPVLAVPGRDLLAALPLTRARRVLEVGAGVGKLLPEIRAAAPHAAVIGVDRSPGMLRRASSAFPRAVMDASRLALSSNSVDVAVCAFVLFHLEDPAEALVELRRVLRPGGMLGILTWGRYSSCPALEALLRELDAFGAPADPFPPHHRRLDDPSDLRALLEDTGFQQVRAWSGWLDHDESPEEFARRASCGPSGRRLAGLNEPAHSALLGRWETRLAAMRPEGFHTRRQLVFTTALAPA